MLLLHVASYEAAAAHLIRLPATFMTKRIEHSLEGDGVRIVVLSWFLLLCPSILSTEQQFDVSPTALYPVIAIYIVTLIMTFVFAYRDDIADAHHHRSRAPSRRIKVVDGLFNRTLAAD